MAELSIMIPTYNRSTILAESINSAQKQTIEDIEILVYDDGSTDGTADIVYDMSKEDKRIKFARTSKKSGEAKARNALLAMAKTQYGMWQDSDDYSNRHRVELQLEAFKRTKPSLMYCCVMAHHKPVGNMWNKTPFYSRKVSRMVATTVFRISQAVKYDEGIWLGSDGVWANEMMSRYGKALILPFMLYHVTYTRNDRMSVIWKDPQNKGKYEDGVRIKDALIEKYQKRMEKKGQEIKPDCVPETICHELMRNLYGLDFPEYWKGI